MTNKEALDLLAETILELERLEDSTLTAFCQDLWRAHNCLNANLKKGGKLC